MITIKFDSRLLQNPLAMDVPAVRDGNFIILEAPAGRSLSQILRDYDIQLTQAVAALVNGQSADLEESLKSGDQVRLLPQIAGGKP